MTIKQYKTAHEDKEDIENMTQAEDMEDCVLNSYLHCHPSY